MRLAHLGKSLSEEHKANIGRASKGRCHTAESIAKMSKATTLYFSDPGNRLKQSSACLGIAKSEEHKRKISEGLRGKHRPIENKD